MAGETNQDQNQNQDGSSPPKPKPRAIRLMRAEGERPLLGESATTLGVRVPKDIATDADGTVSPDGRHGMSVRPSIEAYLPDAASFIPRRYREKDPQKFRNAAGSDKVRAFRLGDGAFVPAAISDRLTLAPDGPRHGVVEPAKKMSLTEYREAIASTRDQWVPDES